MAQGKSRVEQIAEEEARERKKLPMAWKLLMIFSNLWSAIGGWLYVSGWWSAKVLDCTVKISTLDDIMTQSIALAGIVGIITILGGFYHVENAH